MHFHLYKSTAEFYNYMLLINLRVESRRSETPEF